MGATNSKIQINTKGRGLHSKKRAVFKEKMKKNGQKLSQIRDNPFSPVSATEF